MKAQAAATTYTLTIEATGTASGVTIGVAPADTHGAGKGTTKFTRLYAAGTAVTLTAPETWGTDVFASWAGCRTASTVTCKVTLSANATVTAKYVPKSYKLTVESVDPAGGVAIQVSPKDTDGHANGTTKFTRIYKAGTAVTLTAPAKAGSNVFASWTGCTTATARVCKVTVNAAATVTAKYAAPKVYTLTVRSTNPASGMNVSANLADRSNTNYGATPFALKYDAGTTVQLSAISPSGGFYFLSWAGCATSTKAGLCTVKVSGNVTVTANYNKPNITGIKITPSPAVATIGTPLQLTATVEGTGNINQGVTWALAGPSGSKLSAGTLSAAGLYITPYPAPAAVTITATSTQMPAIKSSVTVTLQPPATKTGPALSVDAGNETHAINPLIYGMNGYALDTSVATAANITVARWGGDDTSRYNYQNGLTNSASDWYYENNYGTGIWPDGDFADMVTMAAKSGIKSLGTMPVLGWVANTNSTACSYPLATYPNQYAMSPDGRQCGDGETASGSNITGNDPTVTSLAEPPPAPPAASDVNLDWAESSWAGSWVESFVNNAQTGASGGVAIWDLDNEPAWWDAVHRDVHPNPSTYDEVTQGGIGTALAIKTIDSTAQVSGPVIDYWWNYFYSKKDIENGWGTGPCYVPWQNPADRNAHGGVPMIEYYLQQFKNAESTYGMRLLDYLDLHTYFAATYNGSGVGLAPAGDTGEQEARLNSTRVFWDPTYTDPNFQQPNYATDANYTSNCNPPLQAPQLIPMMRKWVANDYPGTKTAITEYNWGGQESINGAVAQADILGIFGSHGLDVGTLWGPPDPVTQVPGLMAFEMYRNYDGAASTFGDMSLASSSANQGALAVYGALRTADNMVTVMVVNKSYGALTSTLSLENLAASGSAKVYQYSNANLSAIAAQPDVTVTAPANGGTTSTLTATFPGQSITLLLVPQQ